MTLSTFNFQRCAAEHEPHTNAIDWPYCNFAPRPVK
jgi:hypothetical protein